MTNGLGESSQAVALWRPLLLPDSLVWPPGPESRLNSVLPAAAQLCPCFKLQPSGKLGQALPWRDLASSDSQATCGSLNPSNHQSSVGGGGEGNTASVLEEVLVWNGGHP